MIGLSTQVPARPRYISDGPDKTVRLDARTIEFTHVRPKDLGDNDRLSATVIQALRFMGKSAIGPQQVDLLRSKLSPAARKHLLRAAAYASDWIYSIAKELASTKKEA